MEKIVESKPCLNCGTSFTITDRDMEFYDKISPTFGGKKYSIPAPTLCPDCRQQRRLAFRNERSLYRRKCDASGKDIIAIYSSDPAASDGASKPYIVYEQKERRSDRWDGMEYGKDFDFNKPFFQQFAELSKAVPRINLYIVNVENSDYCNYTGDLKNCYLCFGSIFAEDCFYGSPYFCKNCVDVLVTRKSEQSYECIDCEGMYKGFYCQDCSDSNNIFLCYDCHGCSSCIACSGLYNKEYHIANKAYSKEEFLKKRDELKDETAFSELHKEFEELKKKTVRRNFIQYHCEDSIGSYLVECKDVQDSFYVEKAEHSKFLSQTIEVKNSYDVNYMEESDWIYDSFGAYREYQNAFCNTVYQSSNMLYCDFCVNNCKNCFGCVGLKNREYCILNKQYSKSEYETLVPKIIEHMTKAGERGEYFPISISPFAYNETVAHEYFPLSQTEIINNGRKRKELEDKNFSGPVYHPLPIEQYDESKAGEQLAKQHQNELLNGILKCKITGRPFKIVKPELEFYIKNDIPITAIHPDQRHIDRVHQRNPRKIFDRKCDKCGIDIKTSYAPERKEIVYCGECYNKEIYG